MTFMPPTGTTATCNRQAQLHVTYGDLVSSVIHYNLQTKTVGCKSASKADNKTQSS